MQSANTAFVIAQAQDERRTDAIGKAVAASIEVGVVVPSILRRNLADAGFTLDTDEASLSDYGFRSLATLKRVLVRDGKGNLVAMGASGDLDDALLHAMLGYFRENALPESDVPEGIAVVEEGPAGVTVVEGEN